MRFDDVIEKKTADIVNEAVQCRYKSLSDMQVGKLKDVVKSVLRCEHKEKSPDGYIYIKVTREILNDFVIDSAAGSVGISCYLDIPEEMKEKLENLISFVHNCTEPGFWMVKLDCEDIAIGERYGVYMDNLRIAPTKSALNSLRDVFGKENVWIQTR